MILRTLVASWLKQHAKEQLMDFARESMRDQARAPEDGVTPRPACEIGIVLALGMESGGLIDILEDRMTTHAESFVEHTGMLQQRPVVVVETGMGLDAATRAMRDTLLVHPLKWVISAGFAAGLRPDLQRGHIVMAEEVVDAHGHHIPVDLHVDRSSLAGNPGLHLGRLLTVDHLVRRADEKHRLGENHAASACDMESIAIAKVCRERNVRFLSVRIISETVDEELPQELQTMMDEKSLPAKLGAAAGAIFKRPSSVKSMWQVKEDSIQASDRLARFLSGVVANMPNPGN